MAGALRVHKAPGQRLHETKEEYIPHRRVSLAEFYVLAISQQLGHWSTINSFRCEDGPR